jgi:hypothetical protein
VAGAPHHPTTAQPRCLVAGRGSPGEPVEQAGRPYSTASPRRQDEHVRRSIDLRFVIREVMIVAGAIIAYFGVRGLTEGDPAAAHRNADRVLDAERSLGLAVEEGMQRALAGSEVLVDLANWIYIWAHWPIVIGTLVWLLCSHRSGYTELRNAMIISGLIGLVVFAAFPVAPPRLYGSEYVDTVTLRSYSYRVLQPPAFVNRFAALPSLHFGWNLLIGIVWFRLGRWRGHRLIGLIMPLAMAWAVVATANHWVLDVVVGGAIALVGLWLGRSMLDRASARHDRNGRIPVCEEELSRQRPSEVAEIRRQAHEQFVDAQQPDDGRVSNDHEPTHCMTVEDVERVP